MTQTDQAAVADFLARPESYGLDAGEKVERIDTHGAMVFLAGNRVYKIKRAVRYPYMDFSTLEKRRRACEREVTLNRRTAPALYLGVTALTRQSDGSLRFGGAGEAVEYAVEMRRFEQAHLFDRMAQAGTLGDDLLDTLADAIAEFHALAEISCDSAFGGRASMDWVIAENYQEHRQFPDLFPAETAAATDKCAHAALNEVAELLEARRQDGYVRHCHGDLHLCNICLLDGAPTLIDAIEFNDNLAIIDTLYDLAFLLMDFEHRGMRRAANRVFNRYLGQSGDIGGLAAMCAATSFESGCLTGRRAKRWGPRATPRRPTGGSTGKWRARSKPDCVRQGQPLQLSSAQPGQRRRQRLYRRRNNYKSGPPDRFRQTQSNFDFQPATERRGNPRQSENS